MAHYLLSTQSRADDDETVEQPMSDDDMKQFWGRVIELEREMKSAGAWVFGGKLHDLNTATVVRMADGKVVTTDGPFVEANEYLGGFYIISAPDLDAAMKWAVKVTAAIEHPIEIRPFAGVS
ncbi:MAG: YciI family protein [Vulcanimicrobiaceae bacterium]